MADDGSKSSNLGSDGLARHRKAWWPNAQQREANNRRALEKARRERDMSSKRS